MKTNKRITKISIVLLLLLTFITASDCSVSQFYHDKYNPCIEGEYRNEEACNDWKARYPKEYKRFLNRIELDTIK